MATWAEVALGLLSAAIVTLVRWLAHVHGRVNDLRERVARLEQRAQDDQTPDSRA